MGERESSSRISAAINYQREADFLSVNYQHQSERTLATSFLLLFSTEDKLGKSNSILFITKIAKCWG